MSDLFLIRDRRTNANEALWWKPEAAGYTINIDRAGRYAKKPQQFSDDAHEWVPEHVALAAASRFVLMDDLIQAQTVAEVPK